MFATQTLTRQRFRKAKIAKANSRLAQQTSMRQRFHAVKIARRWNLNLTTVRLTWT